MYLQDVTFQLEHLAPMSLIGNGEFSKVFVVLDVQDPLVQKSYALRQIDKQKVVELRKQHEVMNLHSFCMKWHHPFVCHYIRTLQDEDNVYFLMELLDGGDLFSTMREMVTISKACAQFFSACIALGLEYLHSCGVMYRDLKPENIRFDSFGYAKLVDFGCCKAASHTSTLVGTPEYTAPEVILGRGYTCSVDWWSLGVVMYELICGPLPFASNTEDQMEVFSEILEAPLTFPKDVLDKHAISIMSGLLEKEPARRLCAMRGAIEFKEHHYFGSFDWCSLLRRTMTPPSTPDLEKVKSSWKLQSGGCLGKKGSPPVSFSSEMMWAAAF